jgi:hypothetical protein
MDPSDESTDAQVPKQLFDEPITIHVQVLLELVVVWLKESSDAVENCSARISRMQRRKGGQGVVIFSVG